MELMNGFFIDNLYGFKSFSCYQFKGKGDDQPIVGTHCSLLRDSISKGRNFTVACSMISETDTT
jgi:hypothetical protein